MAAGQMYLGHSHTETPTEENQLAAHGDLTSSIHGQMRGIVSGTNDASESVDHVDKHYTHQTAIQTLFSKGKVSPKTLGYNTHHVGERDQKVPEIVRSSSTEPPVLTPGSSRSSSPCSSNASSRSSSPYPCPLTPGAASTEIEGGRNNVQQSGNLKNNLSPCVTPGNVLKVGFGQELVGQDCATLQEGGQECQPPCPSSPRCQQGSRHGSLRSGLDATSRPVESAHPGVESTRSLGQIEVGLGRRVPCSEAKLGDRASQVVQGENSYDEDPVVPLWNLKRKLNLHELLLSNGRRPIVGKDKQFLLENDLSNSILHLLGNASLCSSCRSCKICSENNQFMTSQEHQEACLYREQLSYNKAERRVCSDFLFYSVERHKSVLGQFGDHRNLALKRNVQMENKLLREFKNDAETIQNFNREIGSRLQSGEILTYKQCEQKYGKQFLNAQKYWHPLSYVKRSKPGHSVRPIIDTAVRDPTSGLDFNAYLLCGPSLNTNLVQTWFAVRNHHHLGISDLDKFFNTIQLNLKTQCLCSFQWRVNESAPGEADGIGSEYPWLDCVSTKLGFGFKVSPYLAAESLRYAITKFCKLPENRTGQYCSLYVDDILAHGDNVQSLYLRIADLCQSLKEASFSFKPWEFTRQSQKFWLKEFQVMVDKGVRLDPKLLEKYQNWKDQGCPEMEVEDPGPDRVKNSKTPSQPDPSQYRVKDEINYRSDHVFQGPLPADSGTTKFLGAHFCMSEDLYRPACHFNLSKRSRGCKNEKFNITLQNVEEFLKVQFRLTQRRCLSLVHACYDLTGVSQPTVFTLKHLYSQLLLKHKDDLNFGYDSLVDEEDLDNWVAAVKECLKLQNFWFRRPLTPVNPEEYHQPMLCCFFDGSSFGTGIAIYYVFEAKDLSHCEGALVYASAGVAGLNKNHVPDLELTALLNLAAILNSFRKANVLLQTRKEYYIGDSLVALRVCQKPAISLSKSLATKVCKVKSLIDVSRLRFCRSQLNCSDILTRPGVCVEQILSRNFLNGGHLTQPVREWEIYEPNDPRCNKVGNPDKINPRNLPPPPGYKVIQIHKGSIKKLTDVMVEDDSQLVEDDQLNGKGQLRCQISYLKRSTLNVKNIEVWHDLLNKFKLSKFLGFF